MKKKNCNKQKVGLNLWIFHFSVLWSKQKEKKTKKIDFLRAIICEINKQRKGVREISAWIRCKKFKWKQMMKGTRLSRSSAGQTSREMKTKWIWRLWGVWRWNWWEIWWLLFWKINPKEVCKIKSSFNRFFQH